MDQETDPEEGVSLEEAVRTIVNNTVAVLTAVPEKQAEWAGALAQVEAQAREGGMADFAAFLDALGKLLAGAAPDAVAAEVPAGFAPAWDVVRRGLAGERAPARREATRGQGPARRQGPPREPGAPRGERAARGQGAPREGGMAVEQAVSVAVENTVAVLTVLPEKKAEWAGTLAQLRSQAMLAGHMDFASFLAVLLDLIAGTPPGDPSLRSDQALAARVPDAFRAPWDEVLRGLAAAPQAEAPAPAAPEAAGARRNLSVEEALAVIVQNTVAVLTRAPSKRGEWWGALGELQAQATGRGEADFARFIGTLRQLVEGMPPGILAADVPEAYREAWGNVVGALGR